MGTRSAYETIARVVQAFTDARTWKQADLARRVDITSERAGKVMHELELAGMPLERDEEPPYVYWSVPPHWFPGGVVFAEEDWPVLVHALARISDEPRKKRLLGRLLKGRLGQGFDVGAVERLASAVEATPLSQQEQALVLLIESALMQVKPIRIKYFSSSSGAFDWRYITPVKVQTEPRARIAAVCHRSRTLKWFRVDNVERSELATTEPAAAIDPSAVELFVKTSVDGFNDGSEETYSFIVRLPEGHWVKRNLLSGMRVDEQFYSEQVFRVVARGAGLVVARFVCGLGGIATAEGETLKAAVRQLATETLASNTPDGEQY